MAPAAILMAVPGAAAAEFPADAEVARSSETGNVRFVAMPPGKPAERPLGFAANAAPDAVGKAYLERNAADLGLAGPSAVNAVGDAVQGAGKTTTVRYQQTLKGVEVLGGQFTVRLDGNRNIVSLNGEAADADDSFDATPTLDQAAAERAAIATVAKGAKAHAATLSAAGTALKVFDPRVLGGPGLKQPTLAWVTTVSSSRDAELKRLVIVDADRGFELATIDETHEAKNRRICDAQNTSAQYPCTSPVLIEGGTYSGPAADVNPAYAYSGATYDFFKTRYNRDSLDGKGLILKSTVRYCDPQDTCPYANAFWDGEQMVYGDTYARADDVVGHELTHGFTEFTSNLFYYYQSGAINESLSDVFGELVDQVTVSPNDTATDKWKLGESLPIGEIRNMKNPELFGDPDRMGSPNYWVSGGDSGGVHINSGVNNKATFLMTDGDTFNGRTVTALGLDKVARLYYVINAEYLTSGSDFKDLGSALGAACDALVGTNGFIAANCVEVRDAVAATEMLTNQQTAVDGPACTGTNAPKYTFYDDYESATQLWAAAPVTGTQNAWSYNSGYTHSGKKMIYGENLAVTSDSAMTQKTATAIPAGAFLRLNHAYSFEAPDYDGGLIEWSENGTTWTALPAPGYGGPISASYDNALGGRAAYIGVSHGYISESIPLTALAGKTVKFRFRLGTDFSIDDIGWIIDDVGVHTCAADTTAPTTTLSGGPAQGSFTPLTSATFTLTANEKGSTFECKLDAGGFIPCISPEPTGVLANGAHTFQVRAVDPAGLKDATPAVRNWTIDTVRPVVTITAPAASAKVYDTTPSFTFSANEPATFACYMDNVLKLSGCTTGWTSALLTNGAHTFKLVATDRAGNVTTATRTFTVTAKFRIRSDSAASESTAIDRILIARDAGNGNASVRVSTSLAGTAKSPGDFTALSSVVVSFTGTETLKSVPLTIVNDTLVEGTETIGVTLSNPVNGEIFGATGLVNLVDND